MRTRIDSARLSDSGTGWLVCDAGCCLEDSADRFMLTVLDRQALAGVVGAVCRHRRPARHRFRDPGGALAAGETPSLRKPSGCTLAMSKRKIAIRRSCNASPNGDVAPSVSIPSPVCP